MADTRFKKGNKPWNAGTRFHLEKTCERCSVGFIINAPCLSGQRFCSKSCGSLGNKRRLGSVGSEKQREWAKQAGKMNWHFTQTEEAKRKSAVSRVGLITGEKHYKWIKDRTLLKDDTHERGGQLHGEWSKQVKIRDGWKCKISNKDCNGAIVAHHILGWSSYPELRYELNNGITLCQAHHPRKRAEEIALAPAFQGLVTMIAN